MGSFDVTCSITNISIGANDEIVFIPLLPNYFSKNTLKVNAILPSSMWHDVDEFFTPFCLPILGKYENCGYLSDIQRNTNVNAIEEFFNMDIESFIKIVVSADSIYAQLNQKSKIYITNQSLLEYKYKFGPQFLLELGFTNVDNFYKYKDYPYLVELMETDEDYSFNIYDLNMSLIVEKDEFEDSKEYLCESFAKLTGYYLNVSDENQYHLHLINNMSGMYVFKSIYDSMALFELKAKSFESNNHRYDKMYADFREEVISSLKTKEEFQKLKEQLEKRLNYEPELSSEVLGNLNDAILNPFENRFSHYFLGLFVKWIEFESLYKHSFKDNELKTEFKSYRAFYHAMYSCNKFLFPALKGEQHGNHPATKTLLEESLKIIKKKL